MHRTGEGEAMRAEPGYFLERLHRLTARERQVLTLDCAGLTAPEMAERLRIGERTVYGHIRRIYDKLELADLREHLRQRKLVFF